MHVMIFLIGRQKLSFQIPKGPFTSDVRFFSRQKKVSSFRNLFLVSSILPKNEQKHSTLLLQVELFSFVFWENGRLQKDISKSNDFKRQMLVYSLMNFYLSLSWILVHHIQKYFVIFTSFISSIMKPLYIKGTMVDVSQLSFSFLSYFVTFSANDREMRNCCRS